MYSIKIPGKFSSINNHASNSIVQLLGRLQVSSSSYSTYSTCTFNLGSWYEPYSPKLSSEQQEHIFFINDYTQQIQRPATIRNAAITSRNRTCDPSGSRRTIPASRLPARHCRCSLSKYALGTDTVNLN